MLIYIRGNKLKSRINTLITDRTDVLSRRVTMFADAVEAIWTSRNDYERRAHDVRLH